MDNPAEADIGAALAARDFAVESFGAALRIANVTSEAEQRPYFTYNGLVSHQVTLIPGDGIGPEVSSAARRAVDATGVSIDWEIVQLNEEVIRKAGVSLPQDVLDSLERTRVGLKGPVTTPIGGGFASVNVALRKKLDLYANVRPVRSLPGVATRFSDVKIDMVIFRENTEDLYSGLEHEVVKDVVTSLKVITRVASIKIAEYAFQFAKKRGRRPSIFSCFPIFTATLFRIWPRGWSADSASFRARIWAIRSRCSKPFTAALPTSREKASQTPPRSCFRRS